MTEHESDDIANLHAAADRGIAESTRWLEETAARLDRQRIEQEQAATSERASIDAYIAVKLAKLRKAPR